MRAIFSLPIFALHKVFSTFFRFGEPKNCSCYVSLWKTKPSEGLCSGSLQYLRMHENDKAILMIRDGWVMWGHLYCGLLAAMSALTFTWPSLAIVRCLYSGSWHHHLLCPFVPPLRSRPISNTTITSSPPPARNWGGHCQDI